MKLNIQNIGNIRNTEITINGITLLAGVNGAGKSTVSKSLFSMFNSFYDFGSSIKKDKLNTIAHITRNYLNRIESNYLATATQTTRRNTLTEFETRKKIISEMETKYDSIESEEDIQTIINSVVSEFTDTGLDQNSIQPIPSKEIFDIIKQSTLSVLEQILTTNFRGEFNNQINNIFEHTSGEISLNFKENSICVSIEDNTVSIKGKPFNLSTDVVYIDDAATNVDDYYSHYPFFSGRFKEDNHNDHLQFQLGQNNEIESHTKKALVTDKLKNIFTILNSTLGHVVTNNKLTVENKDNQLNIVNYSSGMKTFYIIKTLLEKGIIEENGVLILDEPEVHLHPEWQLKLAEIIVLLRKEFGLHILINTHSPYILNALEVYAKKYSLVKECSYYLCSLVNNFSTIKEVENTEELYTILASPLQTLENIEGDIND